MSVAAAYHISSVYEGTFKVFTEFVFSETYIIVKLTFMMTATIWTTTSWATQDP